jgi:hypothetical protein
MTIKRPRINPPHAAKNKADEVSIQSNLDKYGYAFVGVNELDPQHPQPAYVYTVGLQTRGLPELFISGNFSQRTAMEILNKVISLWEAEDTVRLGILHKFLRLKNLRAPVELVELDAEAARESHMRELKNFYPELKNRAVQVLWPDPNGYLPTNENYTTDPQMFQSRPPVI